MTRWRRKIDGWNLGRPRSLSTLHNPGYLPANLQTWSRNGRWTTTVYSYRLAHLGTAVATAVTLKRFHTVCGPIAIATNLNN